MLTILRMFDPAPIAKTFQEHGFRFGPVPGLRLPQRRFTGPEEMGRVISMLRERGLDTREWEEKGKQFADLYIAAPPRQFPLLSDHMVKTRTRVEGESRMAGYIRR